MNKRIKFEGCRCEYKEKEWEVDLTNEPYDENKDLFTCCQCASWDKYKDFQKKQLKKAQDTEEAGHTTDYFIIYGAKQQTQSEKKPKSYTKPLLFGWGVVIGGVGIGTVVYYFFFKTPKTKSIEYE